MENITPAEPQPFKHPSVLYSEPIATQIVDFYVEGRSLYEISRESSMPSYGSILRWLKNNSQFLKRIQEARVIRALHFEEMARDAAMDVADKDDVPAARLKFDAMKWSAEVSDAATYGKKTVISGDQSNPVQFIISTGFPDLTPSQKQPKLGKDGLIEKIVASEVVSGGIVENEGEPSELQDKTE